MGEPVVEATTTDANSMSPAIMIKMKEDLQERRKSFSYTWWGWLLAIAFGSIFFDIFFMAHDSGILTYELILTYYAILTALGGATGAIIYGSTLGFIQSNISKSIRKIDIQLIKAGVTELQENIEENFFTKLVKINFKYIDQYYLQTQEQADKSFRLSSYAAVSGLVIVISGIFLMFGGKTTPAYLTTGAGIISEFISAVFFYLYNRTILKMSQYHQKLVITQNISLALKISEDMLGDSKTKAQEMLLDRLTLDINKYLSIQDS